MRINHIRLLFLAASVWPLLLLSDVPVAQPQTQTATEQQVKAAFLYNFAKFVEWPGEAFAGPNSPLKLCVLGEDPFGSDLTNIVKGKVVDGHKVQVLNPQSVEQGRNCHILFVNSSERLSTRQIVETLRGASVLTVGDRKGFAEQGGVINFVLENDRVRFEVNTKAAEQSHLKISSKLLSVAMLVLS